MVLHRVEEDLQDGYEEAEEEPDVHVLDAGRPGQIVSQAGQHGGHHQHRLQVRRNYWRSIKSLLYREIDRYDVTKPLPVVEKGGEIGNNHDQGCGYVYSHDLT